jgi:hypothetical protein
MNRDFRRRFSPSRAESKSARDLKISAMKEVWDASNHNFRKS